MALNAFKNDVTLLNEDTLNSLLVLQPFQLIYEGSQLDGKTGSGVTENSIASANYCARFTLTGSTKLDRVELELDRDGTGADLVVQIRSGMVPGSGTDGTLLKQVVVPKEFIPDPKGYWSIPINLTGLTSGAQYWLVVLQAGDAVNKVDWIGEAAQDSSYPAYSRNGGSGTWTANNALHFKVFSGTGGMVLHEIYGTNGNVTVTYSNGIPQKQYFYLPPADGSDGGIRNILTLSYSSGLLTGGGIS